MSTHTTPHAATHSVRHPLADAAQRADRRLVQAAQDSDRLYRQMEQAVQQGSSKGSDTLHERRWKGRVEPLVGRLSSSAQHLARQGLDLAANAGSKAQASFSHYADASQNYVARQPLRSVLVAAAVGAGLALLLAAARKRD